MYLNWIRLHVANNSSYGILIFNFKLLITNEVQYREGGGGTIFYGKGL